MKNKLTKEQRLILALFKDKWTYREIAKETGKSVSTIHYTINGRPGKYRKFKGVRHLSTH